MKMLFRQKIFSWFDSYDIYDEMGNVIFVVKGVFSWGHRLVIYDRNGKEIGLLQEKVFTFLHRFEMYIEGVYKGEIVKEFSFFKPRFHLDCNDWQVSGEIFEWDYDVTDQEKKVAHISKELFHLADTYTIDVVLNEDALLCLMIVLAIDAIQCSNS